MDGFIAPFDAAPDYTLQFTASYMYVYTHTDTH
jgi:hypothetical protein